MSLRLCLTSFLVLFLVACGDKFETPYRFALNDVGAQENQPEEMTSRIDCNLELNTVDGKIVRLFNTSSIFKTGEVVGPASSLSTVVFPLSTYSLMARYSKTSLSPDIHGSTFYIVLCKNMLALNDQCATESIIKSSEWSGTLTSTLNNQLLQDLQFQYDQYQINRVQASCTLNVKSQSSLEFE